MNTIAVVIAVVMYAPSRLFCGYAKNIRAATLFSAAALLMCVLPAATLSASSLPDSLKRVYARIDDKHSKIAVDVLNEIAWQYRGIQLDSSLKYGFFALEAANAIRYNDGSITSMRTIGVAFRNRGDYGLALEYYTRGLELARITGNKEQVNFATINISSLFLVVGDYEKAMTFAMDGLLAAQELRNNEQIASAYSVLGKIHYEQRQYDEALDNHFNALALRRKLNIMSGYVVSLREIGKTFQKKTMSDSAKVYLAESRKFAAMIEDVSAIGLVDAEYAQIELQNNNLEAAKTYAAQALLLFENSEYIPEKAKVLELLANIYATSGDTARAYIYLREHYKFHDAIYGQEVLNKAFRFGIQAELDKKNTEITFLIKEQKLTAIIQYALITVIILLALFAAGAVHRYIFRRKSEEKLKQQNEEILRHQELLEAQTLKTYQANQELHILNDELSATNIRLQEVNRFKIRLLSIASHDLKNPLATIADLVQMIRYEHEFNEETEDYLRQIQTTAERMTALVKDLLDTSSMQLGTLNIREDIISLIDVIRASVAAFEASAAAKQQQLLADLPNECFVKGDAERLRQVTDNLLSNAVKFSPYGTVIHISLAAEHDRAVLRVKDHGPGLTDEDKQKMFGFFQRLSAMPTGGEHSSGVGLAIVKHIVELHHGAIAVVSQPGEGAEFIVELPATELPTAC